MYARKAVRLHRARIQWRSAATATATKPAPYQSSASAPPEPTSFNQPLQTPSKWARPSQPQSSDSPPTVSFSKWAKPQAPSSAATQRSSPYPSRQDRPQQDWNRPQRSSAAGPSTRFPTERSNPSSSAPRQRAWDSPASSSRWTRPQQPRGDSVRDGSDFPFKPSSRPGGNANRSDDGFWSTPSNAQRQHAARPDRGPVQHSRSSQGTELDRDVAPHMLHNARSREDRQAADAREPEKKTFSVREMDQVAESFGRDADREDPHRRQALRDHKGRRSFRDAVEEGDMEQTNKQAQAKQRPRKAKQFKARSIDVFIPEVCTVGNLARLLNVRLPKLLHKMRSAGMTEEAVPDYMLTSEFSSLLAMEFNRNPVVNNEAAFDIFPTSSQADPATLPARPPVVTIMGHVDHGKTTLLDTLRHASVAKGEAGGITQHIGAFSVPVKSTSGAAVQSITFLDTPGHAAFSAMRARGARVTDIVVLVVAADDGVMPQTREVIELVRRDEGNVGLVVAINKVDKPGVDVDRVQKLLLAEGVQLEAFGGDVPSVEVSGLTGHGLDQLVETVSALAEMQELKAERDGQVQGHVLESKVHKGLGPVATVLVLRGSLTAGTHIISGRAHAKVRMMSDSAGKPVKVAYPGMAVTVGGWKELPPAGEEALSASEADVKRALANRERRTKEEAVLGDLEAINEQRRAEREAEAQEAEEGEAVKEGKEEKEGKKELRLVIKGDVSGSVEALEGAVQGIGNDKAGVKIVSAGVGHVTESDVMMARASEGMIVAFSVDTPRSVAQTANQNAVAIYTSDIIYRVMEEIKNKVIDLLPKIIEKKVLGEASVLQLFDIHLKHQKIMKIAGCRVVNGTMEKGKLARVVRKGETVFDGPIETLRQLKKDVTEIRKGNECGLGIGAFADYQEGDLIQMYEEIIKPGQL